MPKDELSRINEQMDNLRSDKYPLKKYGSIGKRGIPPVDGYDKASGSAIYTLDIDLPGMLYARFLTSPYPHAAIKSMDTSKAEALPGVRGLIKYDDAELPERADLGAHAPSYLPVLPRVAHFQGEEVGVMVAADTEDIAEEALSLIDVDWEIRPFLLDVEEAAKPGSPLTNPEDYPDSNIFFETEEVQGDVEKGFKMSEHIIEFKFYQHLNTWIGPEVPCGVIRWNGKYPEVWAKQQHPHICKRTIASWFEGVNMSKVQMHSPYQGASFGGWSQIMWCMGGYYCAAILAKRIGRPVKWLFSRREDFYGGEMDAGVFNFKVGFKNNGIITAVKGHALVENQDYPVFGFCQHIIENTRIPHIYGKQQAVRVNKGPTVPLRCEQNSNCHSLTMVCNKVAGFLNMDPVEIAMKNDGADGHDMKWLNKQKEKMGFPVRDSLKECIDKGKKAIAWDKKWHLPGQRKLPNGKLHGLGFTWSHEWEDSAGSSEIGIRIERMDGTASILSCHSNIGVNAQTAYCQIAADELGMRIQDVHFRPHDDVGFYAMTPDSSTNMSVNGYAVRNAARLLKQQILEAATKPMGVTQRGSFPALFPDMKPEDLDIKDSMIYVKKDPSKKISLGTLANPAGVEGPMCYTPELGKGAPRSNFSSPLFAWSWQVQQGAYSHTRLRLTRQAQFMEVEVDPETGQVEITRVVNVNDVGKVINWDSCEGQQYGGTYMGTGRGRTEEVVHDPVTGVMLNGNVLDYKISTMLDVGPIDTILVETGMGYGPYGLVGIGEDVATIVPALIAPAVYNATGKWVDGFPVTPATLLKALEKD
jgi:CO/xanthine dehydrogenase Mo-binding subunit